MPKFTIRIRVNNKSGVPVTAHVGASLIGVTNTIEYYNEADDITKVFPTGKTEFVRYLNTDLGQAQKYDLYVALWDASKTIGTGTPYAIVKVSNAVEKKKKLKVSLDLSVLSCYPTSFTVE